MINEKRQWQLLKEIGFSRVGGSKEEKRAAQILKKTIEATDNVAFLEEFEVDWQDVKVASLKSEAKEYEVTAYNQCANTSKEGLTAPFYYLTADNGVGLKNCEGKIVLINDYLRMKIYEKLVDAKAVGFITYDGELRDSRENTDLDNREIREL
ncbi:MAG TPA: hypothetical protein PLI19_04600, partial [Erysipelotrichaceae bacterium]|nr:hypothetical protein [Erysipelotrichaceae bacterium]